MKYGYDGIKDGMLSMKTIGTTKISVFGHVVIGNLQHQLSKCSNISFSNCNESWLWSSLSGMWGQCCDSVIIVSPAGVTFSSPELARPRLLGFLPVLVSERLDPGLGRKFYKIVSFVLTVSGSVFLPSRVFQSILWRYKLPQYICSPRVHCFYLRHFKTSFRLAPSCPEVLQACLPVCCHPWYATRVIHHWSDWVAVHFQSLNHRDKGTQDIRL